MPQWLKTLLIGSGAVAFNFGASAAVTHFQGNAVVSPILTAALTAIGAAIAHHTPTNGDTTARQ